MKEFKVKPGSFETIFVKVNYFGVELSIPNNRHYITTDKTGDIYAWVCHPELPRDGRETGWKSGNIDDWPIHLGKLKFTGNWRDSLRESRKILV